MRLGCCRAQRIPWSRRDVAANGTPGAGFYRPVLDVGTARGVCLPSESTGWSVSVAKQRKKQPKPFSARFPVRASTALELLAENVRDRRKVLGLSQAKLAVS